jgi:Family of unknown function (DUF6152)
MKPQRWAMGAALTILGTAALLVPAAAHHSSTPFYDATKSVEVVGKVTKFLIRNPHSFLYVSETTPQGPVEWQIELGTAASLTRTGWTAETLKPGSDIKLKGQPSRAEGSHGMCCARITHLDGSPIVPGGRLTEEKQPPK